jgi:hypothetical protein
MARFVHDYPKVRVDLDADVEYLDSFLDLQDQIRREDLPGTSSGSKSGSTRR